MADLGAQGSACHEYTESTQLTVAEKMEKVSHPLQLYSVFVTNHLASQREPLKCNAKLDWAWNWGWTL